MQGNTTRPSLAQTEKVLAWVLLATATALLVLGFSGSLTWLSALGYDFVTSTHAAYPRHIAFFKPLLIVTGGLLLLLLLARKHIISFVNATGITPGKAATSFLVVVFLVVGVIAYLPFQNYPFSMDEYNYLYQAKIFSEGKLYLELPEKFSVFVEQYVVFSDGKLFSKYAPGFSALLTLGVILDVPGLINPALATATLLILFLFVRSFFGAGYGLLAVVLMATNPYFLAYSASYFSQPTALFLTGLTLYLVREYELTSKSFFLPAVGVIAGYAALTRPLDCFCLVVPAYLYLTYTLYKKNQIKKITYPILTFSILFLVFLIYNFTLTGKVSIATYPITEGEFKVIDPRATGFVQNLYSIVNSYLDNGIESIPPLLGSHFLIPAALLIPVAALIGVFLFKSNWRWVLLTNILMLISLYNFHPGTGWPQYGARYYYSGFFATVFFATVAIRQASIRLDNLNIKYYSLLLILTIHLVFSVVAIWEYSYRFTVVSRVWDEISQKCPNKSIVLLNTRAAGRRNSNLLRKVNFVDLSDFRRNPFMSGPRFVIKLDRPLVIRKLNADFPEHTICFYNFDVLRNN